jgi:2'-5' RNA ligase
MHGIVSFLDEPHYRRVEELWAELSGRFDVEGIYVTPYPHFSYQVAESYDREKVASILQLLAGRTGPFLVHTSGLGIFTGPQPILYVPVARSPYLAKLQAELWMAVSRAAGGVVDYYLPERWLPHITLGFGDITLDKLPAIVGWLNQQSLNWTIPVNNFSFIYDDGQEQTVQYRFPFGGSAVGR